VGAARTGNADGRRNRPTRGDQGDFRDLFLKRAITRARVHDPVVQRVYAEMREQA